MIVGVFIAAAVFGVVALTLLLIFRKDLVGVDVSARSFLRLYLYLASLAGVLVFVIGVSAMLDSGMAAVFGIDAVYGRAPLVSTEVRDPYMQYAHEAALRQQNDMLRGITLVIFGVVFWGGHRFARARIDRGEERGSVLHRAYNVLGTFVFGVGTVILLPVGIYQMLSVALITPPEDVFRQGFADSLTGGLASVPCWLVYLMRVVRAAPEQPTTPIPTRRAPVPMGIA